MESPNLQTVFQSFLKTENLQDEDILVSVSGGLDSIVLLDVVLSVCSHEKISVFHIHHGVRKQSDEEFNLVQEMCSEKEVQFYGYKLDQIPKKEKENFWRKERKRLSAEALKKSGADRLLTAHHATDLVETMIFRLTKGTGLGGLSPFDVSTKPFWKIPKSDLLIYANKNKLQYFEDESNKNTEHERNLIRHEVLHHLRKITPNLEQVFVQESQIFHESNEFIQNMLTTKFKKVFEDKKIELSFFLSQEKTLQREFLRTVAEKTPSFREIEDCLKWTEGDPRGNSEKSIGGTNLWIEKGFIVWG